MVVLDVGVRPNESNTEAFGLSSWVGPFPEMGKSGEEQVG